MFLAQEGCSRDESRYTPLSALSSMKPPADQSHGHPPPGKFNLLTLFQLQKQLNQSHRKYLIYKRKKLL